MTDQIYQDVILEQHVRLFRVPWVLNFCLWMTTSVFTDANIAGECLQSEDITRMDWHTHPVESINRACVGYAWPTSAARQPPLPGHGIRRALLDHWCNIPQDQIDNLILSMPRCCFPIPVSKFLRLSDSKIKEGIFCGPEYANHEVPTFDQILEGNRKQPGLSLKV
ncbi:transposable element Tcb1 transposase [Trichonephila clavipes]|nr:transposable element Tcb1 transposase [Trichonephila clavipes]